MNSPILERKTNFVNVFFHIHMTKYALKKLNILKIFFSIKFCSKNCNGLRISKNLNDKWNFRRK